MKDKIDIATFAGLTIVDEIVSCPMDTITPSHHEKDLDGYHINQAKYNSSWDWLMPIVTKIESLSVVVQFEIHTTIIKITAVGFMLDLPIHHGETKLSTTYKSVLSFIRWYNKQ